MRALGISLISLALTTAVIGNAYYRKKQFYPTVVYITKSNPSMAVIYVQAFILVILVGKLMRKVFFGQLRAAEFEHLMERSWYAVTETCLAFTVFRDDFSPKFVALFTLLLFLKSFHWLAEDRVDYMERSPIISWLFHIRVVALLMVLGALDLHFVTHAYQSTVTKGASVQLVFGFEYAILFTIIVNICIKYALHTIDLNTENPWDNKAVFLLYTELIMGLLKVMLYIAFVAIMVRIYTLPLFAFRPMYYTMRGFKKAFNDVILSRRAIHNMNTLYPDATPEELAAADNVCIICREEMVSASKKLPCNHIFHTACLRSWFQRQQTCPTCRLNILRTPTTTPNRPAQQPAQPPQAPQPPAAGQPHIPGVNIFQPFPGGMPVWQLFQVGGAAQRPADPQQQQQQQQQQSAQQQTAGGTAQSSTPSSQTTNSPAGSSTQPGAAGGPGFPFFPPPFPFMQFVPPPPMPPADFSGLTLEELRAMEGEARESVEARLQCLRNIQLLLDASVTLMQQYASVASTATRMPAPAATPKPSGASSSTFTNVPSSSNHQPSTSTAAAAFSAGDQSTEAKSVSNSSDSSLASGSGTTLTKEQEEARLRRLQKFGMTTTQSNSD